ncbi:MAG: DNA alkylation repair protein [Chloroflexota bacterium]
MDKPDIQKRARELLVGVDKPQEFIKDLQALLRTLVDKEATRNYQRIIPDTGKFYGVPKPILWIIAAEIGKYIQEEPEKAAEILKVIWAEGSFEAKQITGKSLEKFGSKYPGICLDFISLVLPEIDNWSVCDSLAMYGVEPVVYANPEIVLPLSEKWVQSTDKWVRRFGVVTLRGYKKVPATEKVFELLALVMEDRERDVRKAVSWILREITKANPDTIVEFLIKQAQTGISKDKRRIIEDGMKKLNANYQRRILELLE